MKSRFLKLKRRDGIMKGKITEWTPGNTMSKEFALKAIDEMQSFYRRVYHFPNMLPFRSKEDFEGAMQVLDGIKELIKHHVTEQRKPLSEIYFARSNATPLDEIVRAAKKEKRIAYLRYITTQIVMKLSLALCLVGIALFFIKEFR